MLCTKYSKYLRHNGCLCTYKYMAFSKDISEDIIPRKYRKPKEMNKIYDDILHSRLPDIFYRGSIMPHPFSPKNKFTNTEMREKLTESEAETLISLSSQMKIPATTPGIGVHGKQWDAKPNYNYNNFERVAEDWAIEDKYKIMFNPPKHKAYERLDATKLYKYPKHTKYYENKRRMYEYLPEFETPVEFRHQDIMRDLGLKLKELQGNIIEFNEQEEYVNSGLVEEKILEEAGKFKKYIDELEIWEIPKLCLTMVYEWELKVRPIWKHIEKIIEENIDLFTTIEICQMQKSIRNMRPRHVKPELHKLFYEKVEVEMKTTEDPYLILKILHAWKETENKKFANLSRNIFQDKKDEFLDTLGKNKHKLIADFFYTWANTKPKRWERMVDYDEMWTHELLVHYEEDILENIKYMNIEELSRLSTALYLLKSREFPHILNEIEINIILNRESIDGYHLVQFMRSMTKGCKNRGWGSDKTFRLLESSAIKLLNCGLEEVSDRDALHLVFAYAVRGQGSDELYHAFYHRLQQRIEQFDYITLSYTAYVLMFKDNIDISIWRLFVDRVIQCPGIIPLWYYRPFKITQYYLQGHFHNTLNLSRYIEEFWECEKYFNVDRISDIWHGVHEFESFGSWLVQNIQVIPTIFLTWNNLFNIHYAFKSQQVAIMLHRDQSLVAGGETQGDTTFRANSLELLTAKVLRLHNWVVLDLTWREIQDNGFPWVLKLVRDFLKVARDKQVERKIIKAKEPKYV